MAVNTTNVQTGMDVLDTNGEKIGSVKDVIDVAAYSETDSGSTNSNPTSGTSSGFQTTTVTPNPSGNQRYLKVDQGGILGIGAKELYIPVSAVTAVVPNDNLTVNCTKDTCGDVYGNKPDFLP